MLFRVIVKEQGLGRDVFLPFKDSINTLRRRIGEWIVSSIPLKSFSQFAQEIWAKLPGELDWMKVLYVDQMLQNRLDLDPAMLVDVQGSSICVLRPKRAPNSPISLRSVKPAP